MKAKMLIIVVGITVLVIASRIADACSGNQNPVAVLTAVPQYVIVGKSVTLDGSASYDPDGNITKYEWDFTNDGSYDYYETASYYPDGAFDGKTTHIYDSNGTTYTAKVRVKDNGSPYRYDTDVYTVYVIQTYYVDPNGDNDNNGLSWDTAFATIQYGIGEVNDFDIVEVNEGTYYETIDFNGVTCTLTSTAPNNWDVTAKTIIDA